MFWLLLGVVALAPLPFGAVLPWSWSLMGVVVGLLLLAWAMRGLLSREPLPVGAARVWPILLFFALAVLWAALQMSPWVPAAWKHPLWADAGSALGADLDGFVSVDPFETGSALLRLLTYGGVFWLALQYGRSRDRAWQGLYVLTLVGFAYAAYGLAVEFSGAQTILWFEKTSYRESLTSVFVNRNSYAVYAGLGLLCATALLVQMMYETYGENGSIRRERLLAFLTRLTESGWVLVVAWVAVATALVLSGSRGGFFSTCIGVLTLFVAVGMSHVVRRRHIVAMAAATVVVGIGFFTVSGDILSQRLAETKILQEERPNVYALTSRAISDSGWTGTGYGTFREIFRIYRDDTITLGGVYDKAHNTYLENALELGIPASLGLVLAVGVAAGYCVLGVRRRRRDVVYPALGVAATALVGIHSLVDFGLQIPAIAVIYAFLLGIGCAQSWSSRRLLG